MKRNRPECIEGEYMAMKTMRNLMMGIALTCLCAGAGNAAEAPAATPHWWKGDDFSWVRGANYIPSYAINDVEQWLDYQPEVVERELELATRLRLNSVRVWLQYFAYETDREKFLANYEDFITRCAKYGIRPMFVLFDGCFGADPAIGVPGWVANPGPIRMQKEYWPKLEKYVDDVVGKHVGDPRILFWDVMNEPSSLGAPAILGAPDAAYTFAQAFCAYVRKIDNTHPATIGVGNHRDIPRILDDVDVVTFHSYQVFEKTFEMDIAAARKANKDKAMLITEVTTNEMGQEPEMTFRVMRENKIGWYFWHLVMGKLPLTVRSAFDTNGTTYCPDVIASVLGFTVPHALHTPRMDRFSIGKLPDEVVAQPTTDETYADRHAAAFEWGRSMAWAGIELPKEIYARTGEAEQLLAAGKKTEAYALFDQNVKALAEVARQHGVFDELKAEPKP